MSIQSAGEGCWGEGSRVRGWGESAPCSIKVKGIRFAVLNWHPIESLGFRPAAFPGVVTDPTLCQEYLVFVQSPPKNSNQPLLFRLLLFYWSIFLPWVIYLCVILKMCIVIYSNAFFLLSTIFLFNQTLFTLTHHISVTATWITGSINIQTWPPCPLPNSHFSSYFTFMRIFLTLCPDVFVTVTLSSSKVIVLFFYYSLMWPRWNRLIVYGISLYVFFNK